MNPDEHINFDVGTLITEIEIPDVIIKDKKSKNKPPKLTDEQIEYLEEVQRTEQQLQQFRQQKSISHIDYNKTTFTLHLNSQHADSYIKDQFGNKLTSGYTINIEDTIATRNIERMEIGITHAEIPKTWYNIDIYNNTFQFVDNLVFPPTFNLYKNITIKSGHYTFQSLSNTLSNLLTLNSNIGSTYTVIYDDSTHTFLFTGSNTGAFIFSFNFNVSDSAFRELGFNGTIYNSITYGTEQLIESVVSTQLFTNESVYIVTNLNTKNIYHPRTSSLSNILAKIPVNVESKSILYYEQSIDQMSRIDEYVIDTLTLELVDEFGRYLNLNSHHWSVTMKIITYPVIY